MKQFIVDAFTNEVFKGNPAAVCIMDEWLPDELMQNIALENNISETAFAVKEGDSYRLRWFTLGGEDDLCGHGTLATSFVLFNYYETDASSIRFETMSGELTVHRSGDMYVMDLPAYDIQPVPVTDQMTEVLGVQPACAFMGRDLCCVVPDEEFVRDYKPDFARITELDGLCLSITARGRKTDCVSRTFCPKVDVPEDPVCGSAHCHLIPYWAKELGKNSITAYQASRRGGTLYCQYKGDRVSLAGKAVLFGITEIEIL